MEPSELNANSDAWANAALDGWAKAALPHPKEWRIQNLVYSPLAKTVVITVTPGGNQSETAKAFHWEAVFAIRLPGGEVERVPKAEGIGTGPDR